MLAGFSSVGLLLLVFMGAIVFMMLRGKGLRDHTHAPKDPNTPFAILFTDIQSSTVLWADSPSAMSAAVDQHNAIMRKCIKDCNGSEVKTIGDSFMVAFKSATDAVRFSVSSPEIDASYIELERRALEAKLIDSAVERAGSSVNEVDGTATDAKLVVGLGTDAVQDEAHEFEPSIFLSTLDKTLWNGIRVRVGIHHSFGECKLDPVSGAYDYYGTLVNTAARVESIGHGGQILVTREVIDALAKEGQPVVDGSNELELSKQSLAVGALLASSLYRSSFVSLGPKPLRGLPTEIEIIQIVLEEFARRVFPPLRLDSAADIDDEVLDTDSDNDFGKADSLDSYVTGASAFGPQRKASFGGSTAHSSRHRGRIREDPNAAHNRAMNAINANFYYHIGPLVGQYAPTNDVERYAEKIARTLKVQALSDFMLQFRMERLCHKSQVTRYGISSNSLQTVGMFLFPKLRR